MQPGSKMFVPHPLLQPYIEGYVLFENNNIHTLTHYHPDYHSIICFDINRKHLLAEGIKEIKSSMVFVGPVDNYVTISRVPDRLLQVIFKPYGAFYLLGTAIRKISGVGMDAGILLDDIKETIHRIEDVYPNEAECFKLFDQYFLNKLKHAARTTATVEQIAYACSIIQQNAGNVKMKEICRQLNMSETSFRAHFSEKVGMTPKAFAQIEKMNHVKSYLEQHPSLDWITICEQYNFFDQTHFIKHFKKYFGCTPMAYLRVINNLECKMYNL
jgi:AraC-like DNA-binding protein